MCLQCGGQEKINYGQFKPELKRIYSRLARNNVIRNLKEIFFRASNIIRECVEVDGTIFLDASISTFEGHTGESRGRLDRLGSSGSIEGRSQDSIQAAKESTGCLLLVMPRHQTCALPVATEVKCQRTHWLME